jgi:hypothetical protein
MTDGLDGLFGTLPYNEFRGTVYLTRVQHSLLYPNHKKYHEHIDVLDLMYVLSTWRYEGRFFQIVAEYLIPVLKRNVKAHASMLPVAQVRVGLVGMLGKSILCKTRETEHQGVLDSIKPDRYRPAEVVSLIFMEPVREITLEMAQLANGSAKCARIMGGKQYVDEDLDCVWVSY